MWHANTIHGQAFGFSSSSIQWNHKHGTSWSYRSVLSKHLDGSYQRKFVPFKQTEYIQENMTIYSIEGNIGSGKSTLIENLQGEFDKGIVIPEPVDKWTLLPEFYKDKRRYAFSFSMQVLLSIGNNNVWPEHRIVERSPESAKQVFTRMLLDTGCMTASEYALYCKTYDELKWKPDKMIYIDTPPSECFERTRARGRSGESVDIDYLKKIDVYHTAMLSQCDHVIVDGTKSPGEILEDVICILRADGVYKTYATQSQLAKSIGGSRLT